MLRYVRDSTNDMPLVGAEIGVYKGENAKEILDSMNIIKLYAIDPWVEYYDGNLLKKKVSKTRIEDAEGEALRRLSPYRNVHIIKKYSYDAVNDLPLLDFLYIDGAHDFGNVWRDIWCFSEKAEIIGGHDYNRKNIGVVLAVNIYRVLNIFKSELHTEGDDWWFVPRSW